LKPSYFGQTPLSGSLLLVISQLIVQRLGLTQVTAQRLWLLGGLVPKYVSLSTQPVQTTFRNRVRRRCTDAARILTSQAGSSSIEVMLQNLKSLHAITEAAAVNGSN
jgi:hypothetical protein